MLLKLTASSSISSQLLFSETRTSNSPCPNFFAALTMPLSGRVSMSDKNQLIIKVRTSVMETMNR